MSKKNSSNFYKSAKSLATDLKNIRNSKKIVFTNGCFDILHPGHIYLLEKAASYGDILVVGLNSDNSVRKLKGSSRPVMNEDGRARLLCALRMVDYVVLFDEETPLKVIEKFNPDVLVKGSEYGGGEIVGEDIVPKTIRIKMKAGYSTTQIIKKRS